MGISQNNRKTFCITLGIFKITFGETKNTFGVLTPSWLPTVVYWFWLTVLLVIPNLVYTLCFLFLHRLSVWDIIPVWVDTLVLFLRWLSHQNLCPKTVDSCTAWQNQSICCQPSSWRCKDRHLLWITQAYSWFCCQNGNSSSSSFLSPRSSPT